MFRTDTKMPPWLAWVLAILPFVLLAAFYLWGADYLRYLAEHAADGQSTASPKLMPLVSEMLDGLRRVALEPDGQGEFRLWSDTVATVSRFATGMFFVSFGVIIGLYTGTFPIVNALHFRFFLFLDKVPPLLLLPVIFLAFGTDEFSKVMLVVIGVLPGVVIDAQMRTKEIRREQIQKAQTLGASEQEIAWTVIFPQILPKMLGTLRLNFKAAWIYVIAGEFIAASEGLGYRVFVVKRYVAMDIIIPYVIWATILVFALDLLFQWLESRYRWVGK